jgi:hypothetical protein
MGPLRVMVSSLSVDARARPEHADILAIDQNGPSFQTEPFDIDELCARLEVAKREREEREAASALRKQVRAAVRNGERNASKLSERRSKTAPTINTSHSNNAYAQQHARPPLASPTKVVRGNTYANIPTRELVQSPISQVVSPYDDPREQEGTQYFASRTTSTDDTNASRQTPTQNLSKRRSFLLFKSATNDESDIRTRRVLTKDRPEDIAKRRSVTSPLLQTRFHNDSAVDQSSADSPSIPRVKGYQPRSMGFVNEYTACFDTSEDTPQDSFDLFDSASGMRPLPIDCPGWAAPPDTNRSLLNLPSLLRKDRKDKEKSRATVTEIRPPTPPPEHTIAPPRTRPHTRSNTAPEGLICEAVRRIDAEDKRKKRKSFGALLQNLLIPNQTVEAHPHCVAI